MASMQVYRRWEHDEWLAWVERMPDRGHGAYSKTAWQLWIRMCQDAEAQLKPIINSEAAARTNTYYAQEKYLVLLGDDHSRK